MHFILKSFNELNVHQLYAILQLREEVFNIEQNCIYKDIDNKDKKSWHLMGFVDEQLIAYARLLPEEISFPNCCSIGRVVTSPAYRKSNYGFLLMQEAMLKLDILFPKTDVKISAQSYLINFYQKFGFVVNSEEYMEDNLPHTEMIKIVAKQ
ncbi:MAG: GNAT family N-acetyltransferase [Sphingobacteriales bacterium]|jgi:ElaA protein|nr:MAG: GNAT family N-acetyltransferase [Sphingobacteriales bacterium]